MNETKIQVKRNPLETGRHKQRRHQLPPWGPDLAGDWKEITQSPPPPAPARFPCGKRRPGADSRTPQGSPRSRGFQAQPLEAGPAHTAHVTSTTLLFTDG